MNKGDFDVINRKMQEKMTSKEGVERFKKCDEIMNKALKECVQIMTDIWEEKTFKEIPEKQILLNYLQAGTELIKIQKEHQRISTEVLAYLTRQELMENEIKRRGMS